MKSEVVFSFLLATFLTLFQMLFFPKFHFLPFASFLIFIILRFSQISVLWLSSAAGICLDLLSSMPFGMQTIIYALAAFLLYNLKKFFSEKTLSLMLFSALASSMISLLRYPLSLFFSHPLKISFSFIATDILLWPVLNGVISFFLFFLPLISFGKIKKIRFGK